MADPNPVVNEAPVTEVPASEGVTPQVPAAGGAGDQTPNAPAAQPGDKTESALLLKSLQEEREKRRGLEARIAELESSPLSNEEILSDEGRALQGEIAGLKSQLSAVQTELAKKDILVAHPVLKDKWPEFEEFLADPENKGMNIKTAAKAFLVEKGLTEERRPGLEQPTGGTRTPLAAGMTAEDVKHLRETNFKKYQEMVEKGQIKIS